MTINNFQVSEVHKRMESLENEAKSTQSQIDEVCPIFTSPVFKSLQFFCSACSY